MNTLSRDVERTAFAEVKGDVCPEAPIWAENSTFYPRGPPSAAKIRRLQQDSGDARFPHPHPEIHSIPIHPVPAHFNPILSAMVPALPSARPQTLRAGTTADRILRIIGQRLDLANILLTILLHGSNIKRHDRESV
jgi:hypothetical protein